MIIDSGDGGRQGLGLLPDQLRPHPLLLGLAPTARPGGGPGTRPELRGRQAAVTAPADPDRVTPLVQLFDLVIQREKGGRSVTEMGVTQRPPEEEEVQEYKNQVLPGSSLSGSRREEKERRDGLTPSLATAREEPEPKNQERAEEKDGDGRPRLPASVSEQPGRPVFGVSPGLVRSGRRQETPVLGAVIRAGPATFGRPTSSGWPVPSSPSIGTAGVTAVDQVEELVLLGLLVLMLFHSAHRFRYTLHDGLQLRWEVPIAVLCYGGALVGSLAALLIVLTV